MIIGAEAYVSVINASVDPLLLISMIIISLVFRSFYFHYELFNIFLFLVFILRCQNMAHIDKIEKNRNIIVQYYGKAKEKKMKNSKEL